MPLQLLLPLRLLLLLNVVGQLLVRWSAVVLWYCGMARLADVTAAAHVVLLLPPPIACVRACLLACLQLGWSHWERQQQRRLLAAFPPAYPLF